MPRYQAVLFDLLTGLLDSWTLWNRVAGSSDAGLRWRQEYLRRTYGAGTYRPYETLVAESAGATGLDPRVAQDLVLAWDELMPWPDAPPVLARLAASIPVGFVTNCSEWLARRAAARLDGIEPVLVSAERAGYYKPRPEPYRLALRELGVEPGAALFVAGSRFDIEGASAVGMDVFWHDRQGQPPPADPGRSIGIAATLAPVSAIVLGSTPS